MPWRRRCGIAPTMAPHDILVVNLSGRGDKDMGILARELKLQGAVDRDNLMASIHAVQSQTGPGRLSDGGRSRSAATREIALAAIDAGADVIELGVPFSDPLADGPVIQRASERAVARGTRLKDVLGLAREIRAARPAGGPGDLHLPESDSALRPDAVCGRGGGGGRRRRAGHRHDRRRGRRVSRGDGPRGSGADFSGRADQPRRAACRRLPPLQGICLCHLARRHYRASSRA